MKPNQLSMSTIELHYVAPVAPSGPDGQLSAKQCSDSIQRLQRNNSRIAKMVRDMDVRVSDIERDKVIG